MCGVQTAPRKTKFLGPIDQPSHSVASHPAAADRYPLSFLDHLSHITWQESVAHHLSDHTLLVVCVGLRLTQVGPVLTCAMDRS